MTDFTAEELVHERNMQEEGADRYRSLVLQARDEEVLTRLPTGRTLVRNALGKVEALIREYLKTTNRSSVAAPFMRLLDPAVEATLALTVVVDGLHRPRKVAALGFAIARALEDEYRFRRFQRDNPGEWQRMVRQTKQKGPRRRRKLALRRGYQASAIPRPWPRSVKTRAGLVLLECVIQGTDLLEIGTVREGPRRQRLYAYPSATASEWLERADERAARLSPLYLPTLDPPLDWEGVEGGGYLTDLVLNRPIARFRGRGHRRLVEATPPEEYADVLRSLNRLQGVGWRVHEPTLVAVEHLLEVGGGPLAQLAEQPVPVRPAEIDTDPEIRRVWRKALGRVREGNFRRRSTRIMTARTAGVARRMFDLRAPFYFPHGLDFRGRAYPRPIWLQPQGPDIARSMLRFAEQEPLNEDGWDALIAYGGELAGFESNIDEIQRVHQDPLEHASWTDADDPFQFLSWCLEVGDALETGYPDRPFLTGFPVYQDASNNGLQLYALLTGDRELARLTNCLPGPKQDIYTAVAARAWQRVLDDRENPIAEQWRRVLGDGGIPRAAAKRPVMTKAYDVTVWSAADYLRDWYYDEYDPDRLTGGPIEDPGRACRYLAALLMGEVDALCAGAVAGMAWLKACAAACTDKGLPFRWTAANGWPVMQEYRLSTVSRVRTFLCGTMRQVSLMKESGKADPRKQQQGCAPNYVHSVDQSIMSKAVSTFPHAIAAVHDAFGSHPNRKRELGVVLRASVVDLVLKRDLFLETKSEVEGYTGVRLPDPPRFGRIEPEEVMAAEFMFA